jgi:hypothetical protein
MDKRTLRARIEKKDISKNEIAQVIKRPIPPCICGRPAYRLNENYPSVCSQCNEPDGVCECKPVDEKTKTLIS